MSALYLASRRPTDVEAYNTARISLCRPWCGLIIAILLGCRPGTGAAQWVAYNDHAPGVIGTQTHIKATTYNARGTLQTNAGYMKDIETGTDLPVSLTITTSGSISYGSTAGVPNAGTVPAMEMRL